MSVRSNPILIGVDGGGTGCRAAIGTTGGILAQAEAGPANVATDFDQALANVKHAINDAAAKAELAPTDLKSAVVHVGLAGVMSTQDADSVASALPFDRCRVTDDRPTTVSGALGGQDGFLVALGTGTIVAASLDGHMRYAGGWGLGLSDQASGAWIGRYALNLTLQCHDGVRESSGLTRRLSQQFGNDPNQILAFSQAAKPTEYAKLAPQVIEAAGQGDPMARLVMAEGAEYLERALFAVGYKAPAPLCLTGGVGPFFRPYMPADLTQNVVDPVGTALDGAVRLAGVLAKERL